jgi:chemotaxis signal transduction protein
MEGQLLVCRTAETYIGFPLQFVQEVQLAAALEPVPDAPKELLGLLNYHGDLVPVVKLDSLLHDETQNEAQIVPTDHFVLVLLPGDTSETTLAGVLVSETIGLFATAAEASSRVKWQPTTPESLRWPASVLLDDRVVHLPDPAAILTPEANRAFQAHLESTGA